ncbi:class IIb bacteriocin, lactobin A/cerein 7B family [Streptococcus suis]|uniref:class IIb bacteriocin, lactobin A/cerein 7B family n=1 Tax=Streptococcus suis TaxID=1307 RepID=UPI0002D9AA80|nr:class IIb bacteriocin, lactobin A/cerein 7B family [Streptococcus suis]NQM67729.1 class IIb bacteriocin, lactobin A/cerein 7B family [Streptococcus suis]NQM75549.1 class IIb bacteriocin, lactobin A/cerein 7B family [Streptococcus suis]NQM77402.1 class IIb bacteriocin, lactobin A/cerein 7B family [Streptococcus suis]NQN19981.1 class IIb bacteriocin, lactobin A/cerein 7B family [Streptococcus suis]CYY14004.1 excreted peptide [Streptococcus suis]
MTKFETMDKMNVDFVALTEEELMNVDGGLLPVVVGGVVVGWKVAAGVTAGVIAGGVAIGAAAGYFANRP